MNKRLTSFARVACLILAFTLAGCGAGNFGSTTAANSTTTTTTLSVSATSVTAGTSVTLSVTVSPSVPGGSVTFLDGTTTLGTAAINTGRATLAVSSLANGTHSITAAYSGSTGYYASSSSAVTVYVSAMLSPSSITLTASPTSGTVGTNILLTATTTTGTTGVVTFYDGTTSLGSAVLANSVATYSTAQLAAGSHSLTAVYAGSSTYAGSTSAAVLVVLH